MSFLNTSYEINLIIIAISIIIRGNYLFVDNYILVFVKFLPLNMGRLCILRNGWQRPSWAISYAAFPLHGTARYGSLLGGFPLGTVPGT